MSLILPRKLVSILSRQADTVCRACGRSFASTSFLNAPAPSSNVRNRRKQGSSRFQAVQTAGNPDVMRKFQEIQAKKPSNDFDDDDDDFADDCAAVESSEASEEGADGNTAGDGSSLDSLPPPKLTRITSSRYVSSAVSMASCPKPRFPEFAVIGRSNVGKSSLINMLTANKGLALVSKLPGAKKSYISAHVSPETTTSME